MKTKRKVVSYKHLPAKFPVTTSVVTWLLLDRIHASGVLWGVGGTIIAIAWVASILEVLSTDSSEPQWSQKKDE